MTRSIRYTAKARRHLKRLPRSERRRVIGALVRLASAEAGDIRQVKGQRERFWRLRAGDWRIFFQYEADEGAICVAGILHRSVACRQS